MIDQAWRRRLKTLADRLEVNAPSIECTMALKSFREKKNPEPVEHKPVVNQPYYNDNAPNYDELVDKATEKVFDTAILASVIFTK